MKIKRRINHTGREKVLRDMVAITLHDAEQDSVAPSFDATFDLGKLDLSDDGKIFVEGYHRSTSQRFAAGTVREPQAIHKAKLDEIDLGGRILFRVVVVDESGRPGRLLASANRIAPVSDGDEKEKDYLISVKAMDLGDVPWSVDLQDDSSIRPVLLLNSRIPGAIDLISQDARIQAMVLPAVIREIYTFIGWDCDGSVDGDGSWQEQWLEFGRRLVGSQAPLESDASEYRAWFEEVVDEFSRIHELVIRSAQRLQEDG